HAEPDAGEPAHAEPPHAHHAHAEPDHPEAQPEHAEPDTDEPIAQTDGESPQSARTRGSRPSQEAEHHTPPPPTVITEKKWYIVHTYSGHENKAKLTLLERVRNANLQDYFGDVLVPTESVTENVKGQKRTTTKKFFPGYMFVQMALDDRTFHLVKNT